MFSLPREIAPLHVSQHPHLCITVDRGKGEGEETTARILSPPALAGTPPLCSRCKQSRPSQ